MGEGVEGGGGNIPVVDSQIVVSARLAGLVGIICPISLLIPRASSPNPMYTEINKG